jgi:hypothetical protein
MAQAKLDLFFLTPGGFDGHLELTPGEGESAITLMSMADKKLAEMGCKPRPTPGRFGGSGGKAKEPLPASCPVCDGVLVAKDWTAKDSKKFKIWRCQADDQHFKKFLPV